MLFGFYLLFMAFLTTSLVLAARNGEPGQYDSPLDRFRIFCEVVTLLFVFYDLVLEIYELGQVMLVKLCFLCHYLYPFFYKMQIQEFKAALGVCLL